MDRQASREACHGPLCCLLAGLMRSPPDFSRLTAEKKKKSRDSLMFAWHLGRAPSQTQPLLRLPHSGSFPYGLGSKFLCKNSEKWVNHALKLLRAGNVRLPDSRKVQYLWRDSDDQELMAPLAPLFEDGFLRFGLRCRQLGERLRHRSLSSPQLIQPQLV